jgi:hypothetical protein
MSIPTRARLADTRDALQRTRHQLCLLAEYKEVYDQLQQRKPATATTPA